MPAGPRSKPVRFTMGDRVIHKSNPFSTKNGHRRVRHGVVKDVIYKVNARGASHPWLIIKFDGSDREEQFMASRIEHEANKEAMLADAVESVNVW